MKYGRWTVIGPTSDARKVVCRCECETVKEVNRSSLTNGSSASCGCLRRELVTKKNFRHGDAPREKKTKEYRSWCHMLGRCDNPTDEKYPIYGGRGITVCDRWRGEQGYANFLADMGRAPSLNYSIEREDRNDHYKPGNCIWASPYVQANNTSRNVFVTYQGATRTVSQLARDLGLNRRSLAKMLSRGVPLDEAIKRVSRDTTANFSPRSAP